ncbi:hypothetical protein OZX62_06465 [Bifidobacterium sp. ESL0690]|uniref:hypothetical protein n=1 Tax=Bifidobacterium sp. ESL0690 TaxID=2983214 RepID=UPI0023F7DA80|nr:hypothetical protein [Bifidobacterium sp. ESL0690]WEV46099.1 hypothetical protein OZX62_06465 [Bifidobacterium sp. ESL0690]
MELVLSGNCNDAFEHLYLVGLASILEDADPNHQRICLIRWKDREHAVLKSSDDVSWQQCADIVHEHALRWSKSYWLNATGEYWESSKEDDFKASTKLPARRATLSPRLGKPNTRQCWQRLENDRHEAIDQLKTPLDHEYIGALGEPSYWSGDLTDKNYTPDYGASSWEMVARNRGQEFISGRLLPLAQAVANRKVEMVLSGLRGNSVVDEAGKDSQLSRTPTGLRRPTKTDNAQAWCALFGVSAFPQFKSTTLKRGAKSTKANRGATTGFFRIKSSGQYAVLPLYEQFWTVQKYRSVVRSLWLEQAAICEVCASEDTSGETRINSFAGSQWLKEQGVAQYVVFPQYKSNNVSAPERWLQKGTIFDVLGGD